MLYLVGGYGLDGLQINVKTLTGILTILCTSGESVGCVKDMIYYQLNISPDEQELICNGEVLEDYNEALDYDVKRKTLYLLMPVHG